MKTSLMVGVCVVVAGCGMVFAQGTATTPPKKVKDAVKETSKDSVKDTAKDTQAAKPGEKTAGDQGKKAAGYPDAPKKDMHATRDVRNKKMPQFHVEKWVTAQPDRKNKTILIDFWATWCPPCRTLVPELAAWQKTFKDDLVVIGISDEEADVVSDFVLKNKVSYAVGVDTKGSMKKAVGVKGIPHVLVISSDGIVRWQGFPYEQSDVLTEATLKQIIDADKAARAAKQGEKNVKDEEKKVEGEKKKG